MVKQSGLTVALKCSLGQSLKGLPDSPMYSSGQLICGHLNLYITPFFVCPWGHEMGFNSVGPSELYLDTHLVAYPFKPFPHPLI